MQIEIGLTGLGLLLVISLAFGAIAQLVFWRSATHWMWLIGAAAWFTGGFIASEMIWGTYTEQEIQPIIDGLALDESLLGGLLVGVPAVLVTWFLTRRSHARQAA